MSRRDYPTLIKACEGLKYPVRIVVPPPAEAQVHSTFLDESMLPPNVKVVHDDGKLETFLGHIAHSRLVVIPTKKLDFASTGTSVYTMSMALGKCVIISAGPTADDILTDETAVIVPPEDPRACVRPSKRFTKTTSAAAALRRPAASTRWESATKRGSSSRF